MKRFVGVILAKDGFVFLQRRDDKPGLAYAGMLAVFGGSVEEMDSTELDAAVREMKEETNLGLSDSDLEFFGEYKMPAFESQGIEPRLYTVFCADIESEDFEVYEGVGAEKFSFQQIRDMINNDELGPGAKLALSDFIASQMEK